ncbi:nucleoside triphosphate hydrolase [Corynebacterium poyangense]|uniref:Nucleoside triphosphate hydrolase n=1 Tax=Corynebacterium poyangense TaxID=2684405 RepID=A0A7H0SN01_9CORY|nr:MazG nucleotide pyrophosphohydrolase domain-containing protein [Corynebacterium poyangense]QNQ89926.1 nucleoside triphosphate hydrolase [Corynebacterium poyangense]
MTVLLLDPRWPTQIPLEGLAALHAPLSYTGEVPIAVRWHLADVVDPTELGNGTLVSTDPHDPELVDRVARGERLITAPSVEDPIREAREVMHRACTLGEWEAHQTHRSLLPYLQEESDEFRKAVETNASDEELCQELGDLLLQVLFHAELASRRGAFSFDQIALSFITKMRRRCPYLFDGTTVPVSEEEQIRLWLAAKNQEE